MASDPSTERIIDLLYGELSPDEEADLRAELSSDPALRAELDGFESVLDRVRGAMPAEDVPSSVHASIMEAARTAATQGPDRDRIARRSPEGGVWSRLAGSSGAQIALVATILLVGAFTSSLFRAASPDRAAPASDISAASEPAPMPPAAPAEQAIAEEEAILGGELAEAELPEAEPADEVAAFAGAEDRRLDDELRLDANEEFDGRANQVERQQAPSGRLEDSKMERKDDVASRTVTTKRRARKSASAPQKIAPAPDPVSPEPKPTREASGGKGFASAADEAQPSVPPAEGAVAAAEAAKPDPTPQRMAKAEEKSKEYVPTTGTASAVEARWRNRDYSGTIRAADEFVASGNGSPVQNARALHLKAQAMMAQGQYAAASRIFSSIASNYPEYKSAEIKQGQAEANERLRSTRQRQKKAAPKPSLDYEQNEAMPSSLD